MMRKLRALGITFAAALMLSSLAASAASANVFFEVGATPATITATTLSAPQEWTIGGLTVICKKVEMTSAKQTSLSSHEILFETVKYSECSEPAKLRPATVTVNCMIKMEVGTTVNATEATGSTSITKCPGTGPGYEININSGQCVMKLSEGTFKNAEFVEKTGDLNYFNTYKALAATYKGAICGFGIEMTETKGLLVASATLQAISTTLKLSNIP